MRKLLIILHLPTHCQSKVHTKPFAYSLKLRADSLGKKQHLIKEGYEEAKKKKLIVFTWPVSLADAAGLFHAD